MKNIAIVLGSKGVNATGLIRSLGEGGIETVFASSYSKIESRFCNGYLQLPKEKKKWLPVLTEYVKALKEKPIIFPVDDDTACFLDDNYESLKEYCLFSNVKGNLRTVADKYRMSQLALKAGLNVPEFEKINLNCNDFSFTSPVIIKPYAGFAGSKGDIKICRTAEEYNNAVKSFKAKGYEEILVQKLIDFEEQYEIGLMGFALSDGTVKIPCTIKKIRSYPTGKGSTSFAQIKNGLDKAQAEALTSFVQSTGYEGIFDIEMIVSGDTAYFIEINFRNGQYGYAPTKAGYNIPKNCFNGMLGLAIEECSSVDEIFYINERDDFGHVKNGEITLKSWLADFKRSRAYGMYCPKDQRPFIRQYVKIPDRVKILFKKVKDRILDLLIKEEWTVAIRPKTDKLLFEEGGCEAPFTLIKNSFRYWAADPFIISKDDKDYLFFEMFDRFKSKGLIGYRIIENGKIGKMRVVYESKAHLSFPFIFSDNGEYYMVPESAKERKLMLLKSTAFPNFWEKQTEFFNGTKVCDSVLLKKDGNTYLFTHEMQEIYTNDTLSAFVLKNNELIPFSNNPVVTGADKARMAGKFTEHKGELIRAGQNCLVSYGDAVTFSKVTELSPDNYSETVIASVKTKDIKLENKKNNFCGIHTYNCSDRYEVVDLKNKDLIRIGNIINIFYRILRRK